MALDGSYTGLLASIAAWIDRQDLAAVIPDFVSLFEMQANQEAAIRTIDNKTSTPIVTVAGQNYISLPSDFLAPESVIITASNSIKVLNAYGTAAAMYKDYPDAVLGGTPSGFLPLAGKLELARVPDAAYNGTLYYYTQIPQLAAQVSGTNWLLTKYPNLYLFGSLVAAEAYLGADPRLKVWGDLYDNFLQKLQGATDRQKYGGTALVARTDNVV